MLHNFVKQKETSMMSIDVEDGLNILMNDFFNIKMPPTQRVIKNVNILLNLFEGNNVRGTFFILGEIAASYPDLVRSISKAGHEIGVHGLHHEQLFRLSRDKAKEDIFRAREMVEDISGTKVYGFRAPAFSISQKNSWALELIAELGFQYDSSIMPAKANRYGWPGFNKEIVRLEMPDGGSLIEVPLSVVKILGRTVPACGGGYLRHLPYFFTRNAINSIQKDRPAVIYLHPYELDKEKYPDFFYQARSYSELRKRLPLMLYRLNKKGVEKKLRNLVMEFNFKPIKDVIEESEKQGKLAVKYL